jgi:hypothetical protein
MIFGYLILRQTLHYNFIKIDRRVDLETQEHLREIEIGVKDEEEKVDLPDVDVSQLGKRK